MQSKESVKALQNGVGHLANERRTKAAEMAALEKVVQVDTEQFKGDAHMSAEDEVLQHVDHVKLVFSILLSSHKLDTNAKQTSLLSLYWTHVLHCHSSFKTVVVSKQFLCDIGDKQKLRKNFLMLNQHDN